MGSSFIVNPWLIHVNVWQKPLQYCKVISLQLIKINENKKKEKVYAAFLKNIDYDRQNNALLKMFMGFPGSTVVKNPSANAGNVGSIPVPGRPPWRKKWQPTPVFLSVNPHGQRNLAGCSPWGRKELVTT